MPAAPSSSRTLTSKLQIPSFTLKSEVGTLTTVAADSSTALPERVRRSAAAAASALQKVQNTLYGMKVSVQAAATYNAAETGDASTARGRIIFREDLD